MSIQIVGLKEINGPLVVVENVEDVSYDEMAELLLDDGSKRLARVVEIQGTTVVLQVFEGTNSLSLTNTKTKFKGKPMEMVLSKEMLGRIFSGAGKPIDGLGEIYPEKYADVNGKPLNPVSREYPRNYIRTGVSSIDALMTLIRGQKLPIFSGSGMSHNKLAVQLVCQSKLSDDSGSDNDKSEDEKFCIVFAAMGVNNDVADYFKRSFEESGVLENVVMFLNLANDSIVERILAPRCALTTAEYLAYEQGMNVLVIMTDITSYAEALREFSSSKGEIPGRKGYPGYLYSDLASLYERAGIVKGSKGSVTQIPILTMPNDDITHPVPDLTGYITEGQIVLDRGLEQMGIYPPISVLPSLSRLMKDGIGEGFTRADHGDVANQLFASCARVQEARALASVIGAEELSMSDKAYLEFGKFFEKYFVTQGVTDSRTIEETLELGWDLLSILPLSELSRMDSKLVEANYNPDRAPKE